MKISVKNNESHFNLRVTSDDISLFLTIISARRRQELEKQAQAIHR